MSCSGAEIWQSRGSGATPGAGPHLWPNPGQSLLTFKTDRRDIVFVIVWLLMRFDHCALVGAKILVYFLNFGSTMMKNWGLMDCWWLWFGLATADWWWLILAAKFWVGFADFSWWRFGLADFGESGLEITGFRRGK